MANDLESAQTAQLFIRGGELWEVVGFNDRPSVEVRKVGVGREELNGCSVIASSPYAAEWTSVSDSEALEILRARLRA